MNNKIIILLILLFSTQGFVNDEYTFGFLPRPILWVGHLIIIFMYFKIILYHLFLISSHKIKRKFDLVEILLIVFFMYGTYLIIVKDLSILAGIIGIKNFLMYPMIYLIIKRNKTIDMVKLFSIYKYILLLQIPVIVYQGIKFNWISELLTGTWGFHTTGINGVMYISIAFLGIVHFMFTKKKKALVLTLAIIINGLSGVKATFLLFCMGIITLLFYQLIFANNKIRNLSIMILATTIIFFIVDYSHLYIEGNKISTIFINQSSEQLRNQVVGYGTNRTLFGRITSLIFVWEDLNNKNILLTGNGPGLSRATVMGGMVSVEEAFTFTGSGGGLAPLWYEYGSIGIILYMAMIISCILSLLHKGIKNKYLRKDPFLVWGIIISILFLFGPLYTNMWHIYAAFHYWLFMGLIFRNMESNKNLHISY